MAQQRWFEPKLESISSARRFAVGALELSPDDAQQVALLVSELATNAVIHARSPYRVDVDLVGSTITIGVTDRSEAVPVLQRTDPTSVGGGRGLAIVAAIATRWGVDPLDGEGKTTWFELDT